jgi:hypothetical protein
VKIRTKETPHFPVYKGKVEAEYVVSEIEILSDLFAAVVAVSLKPVNLTKSGIPPKPFWNALNQRLKWPDPSDILYDWEEIDQVRLIYLLAAELDLVRPDEGGWLEPGPGGDQFFFADNFEQAGLLLRAYLNVFGWDERCDARNRSGNRYNFGKAYRRDFIFDVQDMRKALWENTLSFTNKWSNTTLMARKTSLESPALLLSEVSPDAVCDETGLDKEKQRLVDFWLTMLSRFGWADMARGVVDGQPVRLCRLNALGLALVTGRSSRKAGRSSLLLGEEMTQPLTSEGPIGLRYLALRLGQIQPTKAFNNGKINLNITHLKKATSKGFDGERACQWLVDNVEGKGKETLMDWQENLAAERGPFRLLHNSVALEFTDNIKPYQKRLKAAEISLSDRFAVASGERVPALLRAVSGEPEEGFDYSPDEPLAVLLEGPVLQMYYEALPIMHRDLLSILEMTGDPPSALLDKGRLNDLKKVGWNAEGLCQAITQLTGQPVPSGISAQFSDVLG